MNPEKHLQDVVCDRGGDNGRWSGDASAATFISEILPMMGTVTEPQQYSASNGLGVQIKQSSDSMVLRLLNEGYN